MSEPQTHTLEVPGAVLTYDVRPNESSTEPVLLMIGSPMGAAGFGTLSGHFAERTVVTYDPRGAERSRLTDGTTESSPDDHADDLHRLISALDAGAVDIFASSGGAVNALALVARHPEQVGTLVAHEPPVPQALPDREHVLAAVRDIHATYQRSGWGHAMAKFVAVITHNGPIPADFVDRPAPDPAAFGLPTEDDGSRNDVLFGQNIVAGTHYELDFEALRASPARIVVAAGTDSEGEMASRAAHGVAECLGTTLVTFPSNHGGFLGGEYGQMGEPDAFAAKLREVLAATV
jgi:pimeloyl-ACP methyl ester carboxylesterase